jgi:hypothetical protein
VPVYTNTVRLNRDFTISPAAKSTTVEVRGHFNYQACDDHMCYLPKSVPFALTIDIESLDRERVPETLRRKRPGSPD